MKICAAQARPVKGDIRSNIVNHRRLIEQAVGEGASIIIFPELSLTGYEPTLAKELATTPDDNRLDIFQEMSNERKVAIGAGIPTKNDKGICISMVIFQPQKERQVYSKGYLHADEEPFFVSGPPFTGSIGDGIALAICYELSVPEHSENAHKCGAEIYIASVAKTAAGVDKANISLAGIARDYSMTVLMANCIGDCDGDEGGGRSAVWNNKGQLMDQLDDASEGILIIDTSTGEMVKKMV